MKLQLGISDKLNCSWLLKQDCKAAGVPECLNVTSAYSLLVVLHVFFWNKFSVFYIIY